MPSTFNTLYDHVVPGTAREVMAKAMVGSGAERFIIPAAGRFDGVAALVHAGTDPGSIVASDITLFGSIIGHLADPERQLADLGLTFQGEAEQFTDAMEDTAFDLAAAAMLAVRYERLTPKNQYAMNLRAELRMNRVRYRAQLAEELRKLVAVVAGVRFLQEDPKQTIDDFRGDDKAAMFLYPPGWSPQTYVKLLHADSLKWNRITPSVAWDKAMLALLYEELGDAPLTSLIYSVNAEFVPEDWVRILAVSKKYERTDYLVANRPLSTVHTATIYTQTNRTQPRIFEVYNDQVITPESTLEFVEIDRPTCLYYRDLFVHRLGTTQSEWYLAMLIDGRLVTVMGLNRQKLMHFRSDYVYETFGISVTSFRYKRLGKLFMLALTTEAFHRWMRLHTRQGIRKVRGIITTSLTKYAEGKTDRGVMQVMSREQLDHGVWKILYKADFRDEEFSTTLANWLASHGAQGRSGTAQDGSKPSQGTPQPLGRKARRKRQETAT